MEERLEAMIGKLHPWLITQAKVLCHDQVEAEGLVREAVRRFTSKLKGAVTLPSEDVCASRLVQVLTRCFFEELQTGGGGAHRVQRERRE